MASLSYLITWHRQKAGLTMQQCADEIGIAMSTLWRWEEARVLPSTKYLKLFAHVIGLDQKQVATLMNQYKKQAWEGRSV